nr:MAG TPA: hypothetical protein [Caudoviricetes sp.]
MMKNIIQMATTDCSSSMRTITNILELKHLS